MDDNDGSEVLELELPDGVHGAEQAFEVLRGWIADGGLHVIFNPETFSHDVSEWGRMLGDIAQHIAHAVELDGQMTRNEALEAMAEAFDRSIAATETPNMSGRIKGRVEH